jgi:diguanylate cyclase (GGDEF)-like protein/PAS domain S-box-containing protein
MISIPSLHNLSISKKLSLFLLLPFIALLFFAGNTIIEKKLQLTHTQNTQSFSHVVAQLSQLVYQLQKERGLSAGLIGNTKENIYRTELTQQRNKTDAAKYRVTAQFTKTTDYFTEDIRTKINNLNKSFSKLKAIRQSVDLHFEDSFNFYSQVIDEIIDIISFLPTLTATPELHSLAASYIELIWLEEFFGQERGALNNVFSSQKLKNEQFNTNTINSYISGQQVAIRSFYKLATDKHQQLLDKVLSDSSTSEINHIREIVFNRTQKRDSLIDLLEFIGYGGLIHSFKNYVIRGDEQYLNVFQQKFEEARQQIESYRKFSMLSNDEKNALNTIETTFKKYQRNLATITELKRQGKSISYIDNLVNTDDRDAQKAFESLRNNIGTYDPKSWWKYATKRLDLTHQVSTTVTKALQQALHNTYNQTQQVLNSYILFAITVFLSSCLLGFMIYKRLVGEIKYIASTMRSSEKNHHYDHLEITGNDELADMVQAFNNMIDNRSNNEEKLHLAARVFSDTHAGIIITNEKAIIVNVNKAFSKLTGYQPDEVIGKNPNILQSGRHDHRFYTKLWQSINEKKYWQGEIWDQKKGGETFAALVTINAIENEAGKLLYYIGTLTDITEIKQQQEKLNLMAHYDVLTDLPNRALFIDRFHQSIVHSNQTDMQLAICVLDLDDFKPINDNYGPETGDILLIEVAKRIKASIRKEDTVSRQGGDEFALLLNDIESFPQCELTLHRIHDALAEPFLIDNYPHKITASSGVTLYPSDGGDIDTLLRHADQAMYQAKLAGKHRYHLFNPELDQHTIKKQNRLNEIKQALDNNEFQLYYQPKVNMVTGDVFGAEALIRWIHPEKGLIPPLDFLPFIEGSELEIKIGNWVIEQALQQLDTWLTQTIKLEVSVNIASYHLLSKNFFIELEAALAKHPVIDSQCLQLEILESSALGDLDTISSIIKTCQKMLGVKIALDDFGTGYSSLTHLRRLPANTIKIDQSFVRDMLDDPNDYAIIDGVIGLANAFDRTVIAEGVEATEHGLMLLVMGCYEAQGYGIAKPMPAEEFSGWLANYTPNQDWLLFGHEHRTITENKIKLFSLITEHWKDQFVSNLQADPESVKHWPILNSKRCPCNTWIKRIRQEQLFNIESLDRLDQSHEAFHSVAKTIFSKYQDGDLKAARESIPELQAAFDEMANALDMCA